MSLPIIFIHAGNSPYLPLSLYQTQHWNPSTQIILLGDNSTRYCRRYVTHYHYAHYSKWATDFATLYTHHSVNGLPYELFCLQRWFILYEFLSAHKCDRALYLDSDVLVYSDLTSHPLATRPCKGMTVVGISGHTNFIHGRHVLQDFLLFIEKYYQSAFDAHIPLPSFLKSEPLFSRSVGSISDMTFFRLYGFHHPERLLDISEVANDFACFDITVDTPQGFLMKGHRKYVRWISGRPFCCLRTTNEWVRFHTLHFQGASKRLLPFFLRPRPWRNAPLLAADAAIYYCQRLRAKIIGLFS